MTPMTRIFSHSFVSRLFVCLFTCSKSKMSKGEKAAAKKAKAQQFNNAAAGKGKGKGRK